MKDLSWLGIPAIIVALVWAELSFREECRKDGGRWERDTWCTDCCVYPPPQPTEAPRLPPAAGSAAGVWVRCTGSETEGWECFR
jgi:hypothetical protein